MKKILASLLVLAMCAPAMALTFSTSATGDTLTINYNLVAGEGLRGLALTVTPVSGDGYLNAAADVSAPAFNTFIDWAADVDNVYTQVGQPGSHPVALITPDVAAGQYEASFPATSFALSMGFLDTAAGQAAITTSGAITIKFTKGTTPNTTLAVALDTLRGGAVGDALTVDAAGLDNETVVFEVPEAVKTSAPFYNDWVAWGKPNCWAFQRQCRGDYNGVKTGPFWVQLLDLQGLQAAYNKADTTLVTIANGICADFNKTKTGPFRVQLLDLQELQKYYNKADASVPVCDNTNFNFWTN